MAPLQKHMMKGIEGDCLPSGADQLSGYGGYFKHGVAIFAGGVPRDVAAAAPTSSGTVLYTSPSSLKRRQPGAAPAKGSFTAGTPIWAGGLPRDSGVDRLEQHGAFKPSQPRLVIHTAPEWLQQQQRAQAGRRFGPGHYAAGGDNFICGGHMPAYVTRS